MISSAFAPMHQTCKPPSLCRGDRQTGKRALEFALLLAVTLASGCQPPDPDVVDSLDSALRAEDFDRAVRDLTALPYLPWAYTPDGCYARALYYSMLLATKGVPTNHLYAVAQTWTTLGGHWGWHVAPLVTKRGEPDRLYVLDPVFETTRALTSLEWIAKQGHANPSLATYPILHVHDGNSYLDQFAIERKVEHPAHVDAAALAEPAFADMPPFAIADVNHACTVLQRHIAIEPNLTLEEKAAKHAALARQTERIVTELLKKEKLVGAPAIERACSVGPSPGPSPDPSSGPSPDATGARP